MPLLFIGLSPVCCEKPDRSGRGWIRTETSRPRSYCGYSELHHRQHAETFVQTPAPDTLAPDTLALSRIEVFHYQAAIREPIVASFGSIAARNALLIRIEDQDGAFGWGEVWANFPPSGAESKVRLLETVILPMSLGRTWSSPAAAWIDLTRRTRRNAIQSGEPGPFAACIAGIEVALSDLAARKARLPLWKMLGRPT